MKTSILRREWPAGWNLLPLALCLPGLLWILNARAADPKPEPSGQARVEVPVDKIEVDDGDTIDILWSAENKETVRILGIDSPEITHIPHNIPFDQPFGREASAFAKGAFAVAGKVELLRASMKDPFGRTLGYLFLDGKNYSELIIRARLAVESVSKYGDNGFPDEARKMVEAARLAGPVPFENPADFRQRMRQVSQWMREKGQLPKEEP